MEMHVNFILFPSYMFLQVLNYDFIILYTFSYSHRSYERIN